MSNRAPFTIHREVAGFDLVFRWWGGEYVEIAFPGDEVGFEVINVWDAGTGEPRIERTLSALRSAVEVWVNDPEMDRGHDLREYAMATGR
jgi:hypothetical protein